MKKSIVASSILKVCAMPLLEPNVRKRLRVGFLLADRFTLSAFANFVDVLRLAADDSDKSRRILCDWAVLSDDMAPIRSSCGVKVQPDTRLRNAGDYDYIVVVGGLIDDKVALSEELLAFLGKSAARGVSLVGLCTGVFILQQSGLLAGYRCCVSWFHHQDFIDRFENETPVSDQLFVVDRNRLTCSGGHGAAHLSAFLVQRHIGQSAATKSLNIMMIDAPLGGEQPQPGITLLGEIRDPLVKRSLLRMQQNIESPKSIDQLAEDLGISRRTLERRFKTVVQQPPQKIYARLRLERALQKLRTTNDPVSEIALSSGFCDAAHLTKLMKAEIGMTPTKFRKSVLNDTDIVQKPKDLG